MRGFVISWYYPPGNSSEGLVTYKLLRNSEFSYDVFTRADQQLSMWDRKTDESNLTADNVNVIQAKAKTPEEWVQKAIEYFRRHADRYDFVMSRVMPVESHEVAARIKDDSPNIPWIASFGDPLADSPYIKLIERHENPFWIKNNLSLKPKTLLKLPALLLSPKRLAQKTLWESRRQNDMRWQQKCKDLNTETFKKADLLVFNNQQQFDRAFSSTNTSYKSKGTIIHHGFDAELYPSSNQKSHTSSQKLNFLYVGHLDQMRNAKSLFSAITRLKQYDEKISEKAVFDFYGHMDDSDKALIVDYNICDLVRVHKDISYLESLQKITEADWLVLIDTNLTRELDEYIYFPAKLVDYMGAQKSILAITQSKGTTTDAINRVGAGQVVSHNADDIYLYLSKIIYQKYNPTNYRQSQLQKYNIKSIAKEFDQKVMQFLDR